MFSLLALSVLVATMVFRAVNTALRLRDAVLSWQSKASSTAWRLHERLASWRWLGALRPRPLPDPLHACGVQDTDSWWTWVFHPFQSETNLYCFEQVAAQAEEDHIAFRRTAEVVVWSVSVFFICLSLVSLFLTKRRNRTAVAGVEGSTGDVARYSSDEKGNANNTSPPLTLATKEPPLPPPPLAMSDSLLSPRLSPTKISPPVTVDPSPKLVPATESLSPKDPLSAAESLPLVEPLPATESLSPKDPLSAAESLPLVDPLPATEPFSPKDPFPAAESLSPVEPLPAIEPLPSKNSLRLLAPVPIKDASAPVVSQPCRTNPVSITTVTVAPPLPPTPAPALPPPRLPPPPWHCPPPLYDGTLRALHQEVLDFQRWAGGSDAGLERRMRAVEDLRRVVASLWPEARVVVTGSLSSGLYLPDSDVDVTLLGQWPASPPPLPALRDALQQQGVARPGQLTVLDRATVPLVKFVHQATGLPVDVSLGNEAAVRAAGLVKGLLRRFPGLAPLSLLVRHYLRGLGLAEVFTGGVSSYSITLMSASLLQLQVLPEDQHNFGWLLLRFFEFYGFEFPYASAGISITDGGRYLRKEDVPTEMPRCHRRADLCIQDPLCPTNDVGRSSFRIWEVRSAFQHAYQVLAPAVAEPGVYAFPGSLLGQLLAGRPAPRRVLRRCHKQRPRGRDGASRRPAQGWRRN